jgi:hypothetical protein
LGEENMKRRYKVLLGLFTFAALITLGLILWTPVGEYPRLENSVQVAAVSAAIAAAVVALSAADPARRTVKVRLGHSLITDDMETYAKGDLPRGLRDVFEHFPDRFASARVEFRLTNLSGFTLNKPTFTFMLPKGRAHPISRSFGSLPPGTVESAVAEGTDPWIRGNKVYSTGFNSNLFNPEQPPSRLEFGDTYVLSNCILPFWNRDQQVAVWIRMIVDDGTPRPFHLTASVNCDNADGWTSEVTIEPEGLMAPTSGGSN